MIVSEVNVSALQAGRIDSEYYEPSIWLRLKSIWGKTIPLSALAEKPYRNPMCYGFKYSPTKEVPFVRIDDLQSPHIEYESMAYITHETNDRFASTKLNKFDLLLGVRGNTIGRLGVYMGADGMANMSPNVIRLRIKNYEDVPLFTFYLVSDFGQKLIKRETSGTGQPTITADLIKKIRVLQTDIDHTQNFTKDFERYFCLVDESSSLIEKAQYLLEAELCLDKLTFQKPVGYTAQFSDLETSHRSDAQHYQPRFKQLIDHISSFPSARVRDIRTINRRGLQPIYVSDGQVDVVNSQHLGAKHIDYEGLEKTSAAVFSTAHEAHIQQDDLLIYTTGAYIGRTNVYLSDAPAMASNHVNILRLKPGIDAAYMALVFQSIIGQFQTQQHSRGSAQAELYPTDIDRFVVPLIGAEKQKVIGDLVRESLVKQQESRQLLEQAKARVEQLIEAAVQP